MIADANETDRLGEALMTLLSSSTLLAHGLIELPRHVSTAGL
jgi:hypothetical protein